MKAETKAIYQQTIEIEVEMNNQQAKEIVSTAISTLLEGKIDITEDMQLIGGESLLDSMKLVDVCLALKSSFCMHRT